MVGCEEGVGWGESGCMGGGGGEKGGGHRKVGEGGEFE